MQATKTFQSVIIAVSLVLGFCWATMTGACASSDTEVAVVGSGPCVLAGTTGACDSAAPPVDCPATNEKPCMRYRITLLDDPTNNLMVRAKYIAAFGDACYVSEANTFDCFYVRWQDACADAVKVGEVSRNAPYDKGYICQPDGQGNYWLQTGSDVANRTWIYFMPAPRQTPLIDINGVSTEVNGPYRNLPEPLVLGAGELFSTNQKELILQANTSKHGGAIHSDLAGFMFPCEKGKPTLCPEPDVLNDPPDWPPAKAEVHHVVPKKDKRCCPWGTNSNKNAVVISRKLNEFLTNNTPPVDEVLLVNQIPPYTP